MLHILLSLFSPVHFKCEATGFRECYSCWLTTRVVLPSLLVKIHKVDDQQISTTNSRRNMLPIILKPPCRVWMRQANMQLICTFLCGPATVRVWEESLCLGRGQCQAKLKSTEWYFLRCRLTPKHLALQLTNLLDKYLLNTYMPSTMPGIKDIAWTKCT